VTSANTIVTTLRTSEGRSASVSGAAQFWQKRARSAFSSPHVGQMRTAES
jgi:hypothetical protein